MSQSDVRRKATPHELLHAIWECAHARKVTAKGCTLKMKFFAPAFLSNERVRLLFGLAKTLCCCTLGLARVKPLRFNSPEGKNLQIEQQSEAPQTQDWSGTSFLGRARVLGWTSVLFALLQSLCTAVLTISGVRVAIGLSALAAASGIYAPAKGWHQDAIRIPMLIVATAGAVINLAVIWWIRHLRNRPSAQWRRRAPSAREKRSVRLQVALAIVTLVLVGVETWTHTLVHRKRPPPPCRIAHTC